MNRVFSIREKVMIVILVLLVICAAFYLFIERPSAEAISEADSQLATLEMNTEIEQSRAKKLKEMNDELETIGRGNISSAEIPVYDNAQNVYKLLNDALVQVKSYNVTPKPLTFEGGMVTRQIQISFVSNNYAETRAAIYSLYSGKYRCNISSLVIVPVDQGSKTIANGSLSVKLTIEFYESQ